MSASDTPAPFMAALARQSAGCGVARGCLAGWTGHARAFHRADRGVRGHLDCNHRPGVEAEW